MPLTSLHFTSRNSLTTGAELDPADGGGAGRPAAGAAAVDEERRVPRGQGAVRRALRLLVPQPRRHLQPLPAGAGVRRLRRAGEGGRGGGDQRRLPHAGATDAFI